MTRRPSDEPFAAESSLDDHDGARLFSALVELCVERVRSEPLSFVVGFEPDFATATEEPASDAGPDSSAARKG